MLLLRGARHSWGSGCKNNARCVNACRASLTPFRYALLTLSRVARPIEKAGLRGRRGDRALPTLCKPSVAWYCTLDVAKLGLPPARSVRRSVNVFAKASRWLLPKEYEADCGFRLSDTFAPTLAKCSVPYWPGPGPPSSLIVALRKSSKLRVQIAGADACVSTPNPEIHERGISAAGV